MQEKFNNELGYLFLQGDTFDRCQDRHDLTFSLVIKGKGCYFGINISILRRNMELIDRFFNSPKGSFFLLGPRGTR